MKDAALMKQRIYQMNQYNMKHGKWLTINQDNPEKGQEHRVSHMTHINQLNMKRTKTGDEQTPTTRKTIRTQIPANVQEDDQVQETREIQLKDEPLEKQHMFTSNCQRRESVWQRIDQSQDPFIRRIQFMDARAE